MITERNALPNRRYAETFTVQHSGNLGKSETVEVTVGYYFDGKTGDGAVGEVFISNPKVGSGQEAIARDAAVLLSLAIQHGVPIETMRGAITREQDSKPSTIIGAVLDRLGSTHHDRS